MPTRRYGCVGWSWSMGWHIYRNESQRADCTNGQIPVPQVEDPADLKPLQAPRTDDATPGIPSVIY